MSHYVTINFNDTRSLNLPFSLRESPNTSRLSSATAICVGKMGGKTSETLKQGYRETGKLGYWQPTLNTAYCSISYNFYQVLDFSNNDRTINSNNTCIMYLFYTNKYTFSTNVTNIRIIRSILFTTREPDTIYLLLS